MFEHKPLFTKKFLNRYTICSEKKGCEEVGDSKVIILYSLTQIIHTINILKNYVSIYEPDFSSKDEIKRIFEGKTYVDIINEYPLRGREVSKVLEIIDKIGLPRDYEQKMENEGEHVDKALVHKVNSSNVLVRRSVLLSDTSHYLFEGEYDTDEIVLDHVHQDHVESTLLNELCRQSTTASLNLSESTSQIFILLQERKIFKKIVNRNFPCYIQTFSYGKREGIGYSVFAVYQFGSLCLKGYFSGINYKDRKEYRN